MLEFVLHEIKQAFCYSITPNHRENKINKIVEA